MKNCIFTTARVAKSSAHAVVHATRATIAARMSIDVVRRRDGVALELFDGMSRKKNLSYPLTNAMHTMYQDSLYGVSARDCHHRGNGPDASQRPISHSRQRRAVLVMRSCGETHGVAEEVGAGQVIDRVSPREADRRIMEPRVLITEKEVHEHGC